jgi:hypothetical protein
VTDDDVRAWRALLDAANEDICGLYEAIWELNTMFPDRTEAENRKLAERVMRRLIAEGLVALHRGPTVAKAGEPLDLVPIAPEEVESILAQDDSWQPLGVSHGGIGFLTTEEGTWVWRQGW